MKKDGKGEPQASSEQHAPLEPDGDGRIGGLEVGWLNSRSNKVERDMEAELWGQAETFLRRMLQKDGRGDGDNDDDYKNHIGI